MKRFKRLISAWLLTLLGLCVNNAAHAQQSVDLIMDNFTSSVISQTTTLLNNSAVESSMRNASRKHGAAKPVIKNVNLSYTPSSALQQKTFQDLSRKLTAKNAAAGQAINNALGAGKTNYNQLFAQLVQESGLPANNAATALAAYLEVGYMIVNNIQGAGIITPAMDKALQRQAAGILSQNRSLTSPTAVAQLGETLKLQAVVLYLGWQSTLKTNQLSGFQDNIKQQFKGMGLDLSQVRLTSRGFVKK
ncbi:hypothetical protein FPZ43_17620 [Mucilaginibacter pallidiroseus]|uniref:DUF4197 domain-containing protein n=1 Tax=Mucilaginibacter pallidiroseus TaxID=2599295 RepID=A0A563U241_9SPHI|nr:DUF6683 family protein [Mucilaginibacter pallidiroseus]TWR24719.1 hypothetical protein FPZ43_17620 [Mucilaginibacter pallidiroseus]